ISVPPPGAEGTMILTGFAGQLSCAMEGAAVRASSTAKSAEAVFMAVCLCVRWKNAEANTDGRGRARRRAARQPALLSARALRARLSDAALQRKKVCCHGSGTGDKTRVSLLLSDP